MFTQRVELTAAPAKTTALIQAVIAQTNLLQAQGVRASLGTPLTGEPRAVVTLQHESLADMEVLREQYRDNAAFEQFQATIAPLQAKLPTWELWELTIVPNVTSQPKYVQRIIHTAALGQAADLREMLSKRVRDNQAKGITCGFAEQLASDAPRFAMVVLFGSLSEFETYRAGLMADPASGQFIASLAPLQAKHAQVELSEVVIPFQMVAQREMAGSATR